MNEMYILHLITRLFQYCTVSNTDVFYYLLNILYWVPFVENSTSFHKCYFPTSIYHIYPSITLPILYNYMRK